MLFRAALLNTYFLNACIGQCSAKCLDRKWGRSGCANCNQTDRQPHEPQHAQGTCKNVKVTWRRLDIIGPFQFSMQTIMCITRATARIPQGESFFKIARGIFTAVHVRQHSAVPDALRFQVTIPPERVKWNEDRNDGSMVPGCLLKPETSGMSYLLWHMYRRRQLLPIAFAEIEKTFVFHYYFLKSHSLLFAFMPCVLICIYKYLCWYIPELR